MSKLSSKYRVTSYDRLGHGYSTNIKYQFNLRSNSELVKKIVTELKLKQPMIIGHSYGGSIVAQLLTEHYNDKLDYMIIDSPLYKYEASSIYKLLSIPILGKAVGFIANYTIASDQIENGIRSSTINEDGDFLDVMVNERKSIWLQPKVLNSKAKESVNYQHDLMLISNKYKSIKANVILVTGNDDEKTFKSDVNKFSEEVSTDSLIEFTNTGHYIQFDKEENLIELIEKMMIEN